MHMRSPGCPRMTTTGVEKGGRATTCTTEICRVALGHHPMATFAATASLRTHERAAYVLRATERFAVVPSDSGVHLDDDMRYIGVLGEREATRVLCDVLRRKPQSPTQSVVALQVSRTDR